MDKDLRRLAVEGRSQFSLNERLRGFHCLVAMTPKQQAKIVEIRILGQFALLKSRGWNAFVRRLLLENVVDSFRRRKRNKTPQRCRYRRYRAEHLSLRKGHSLLEKDFQNGQTRQLQRKCASQTKCKMVKDLVGHGENTFFPRKDWLGSAKLRPKNLPLLFFSLNSNTQYIVLLFLKFYIYI